MTVIKRGANAKTTRKHKAKKDRVIIYQTVFSISTKNKVSKFAGGLKNWDEN